MWLPGSAAQAVKGKFAGARQASIADDTLLRRHPVHKALVDPMAEILAEDATTRGKKKSHRRRLAVACHHHMSCRRASGFGCHVLLYNVCLSMSISISKPARVSRKGSLSGPISLVMSGRIQPIQPKQPIQPIVTASNSLLQGQYRYCRHRPKD